jgi:prophage regulatory protein
MRPIRPTAIDCYRAIHSRADLERKNTVTARNDVPGHAPPLKLLRFTAVQERTGLSRSTVWRLERRGDFPKHRLISTNVVAWVESELVAWIRAKVDVVV